MPPLGLFMALRTYLLFFLNGLCYCQRLNPSNDKESVSMTRKPQAVLLKLLFRVFGIVLVVGKCHQQY